jgi:hypothetical protein
MNEQIRECWINAAREDAGETWDSQEQFIERFAQKVVQECANICWNEDFMTGNGYAEAIERHFGVEA